MLGQVRARALSLSLRELGRSLLRLIRARRPPQPAATAQADRVRGEISRLHRQFQWLKAHFAELSARPGEAVVPAERAETDGRTARYATEFEQILGQVRPERSVQPEVAFDRQRLQRLQDVRLQWLSAVRSIFPGLESAADEVAAVLAEAEDVAREASSPAWETRVSNGLARLPNTGHPSFAGLLPGIDGGDLGIGDRFTVSGLIRAHVGAAIVTGDIQYRIESSRARDVSGLVGRDLVMFDRGERFEVIDIAIDNAGPRRILLRHPALLQQPQAPSGDAHRQHLDQLSDLIAAIRRNLRELGWPGDVADDEIMSVYEQLRNDPATGRGPAAQANSVALYIASGVAGQQMATPLSGLAGGALLAGKRRRGDEEREGEPEPGRPGKRPRIAEMVPPQQSGPLVVAGRYLAASQVELPAGMSRARAQDLLAAVVAEATAAGPARPGGRGKVGQAMSLLGGLVYPAYHLGARLSRTDLDRYPPGRQITTRSLTVAGFSQPPLTGGQNTRFVYVPLAGRSGRFASQGRDASLLLGPGTAVFPPGTTFTVGDCESTGDGGPSSEITIILAETPAPASGPVALEDVIPVTGPGVLGLNASLHRYLYRSAINTELGRWSTLAAEQRQADAGPLMARLLAAINARLKAIGIPELTLAPEDMGDDADEAEFQWAGWAMGIGAAPENTDEVLAAESLMWHEARHAEQVFLALRYLASADPANLTPEHTAVRVSGVLEDARTHSSVPGSPEYEEGKYWASVLLGDGFESYDAIATRKDDLFEACLARREALEQARDRGAGQAELGRLHRVYRAADDEYSRHGYRPYVNTPGEWDAYATQSLLKPFARTPLPKPPGAGDNEPVFYHSIGAGPEKLIRLSLGVEPGTAVDFLVSSLDDIVVVHGRGKDGRLPHRRRRGRHRLDR